MLKGFNHPQQLRLSPIIRHFCDKADDPWHVSAIQAGKILRGLD